MVRISDIAIIRRCAIQIMNRDRTKLMVNGMIVWRLHLEADLNSQWRSDDLDVAATKSTVKQTNFSGTIAQSELRGKRPTD